MTTIAIKERPILFSGPMVRALLAGRKTQTRRIVKPQPELFGDTQSKDIIDAWGLAWKFKCGRGCEWLAKHCPYGRVGERLWVRETFCHKCDDNERFVYNSDGNLDSSCCHYRADGYEVVHVEDSSRSPWMPSIHMPRWASRITLEITDVRVERLNAISEQDAIAEGIEITLPMPSDHPHGYRYYSVSSRIGTCVLPLDSFASLWESINGPGSWVANPWVWVIEFKRV